MGKEAEMSALDDLVRYSDTWEAVEELARLRADRKEAAEVLKNVESGGPMGSCPECAGVGDWGVFPVVIGHADDCRLAALLARLEA
jgi:hypothetical protein